MFGLFKKTPKLGARFEPTVAVGRDEMSSEPPLTRVPQRAGHSPKSDVDTVLQVGVVQVGLVGSGGKDPQLTLGVHAVARLVDVKSNTELYHNYALDHVSPARKFSEWSADGAHLLKGELNRAYGILATSIVDEVFLAGRSN